MTKTAVGFVGTGIMGEPMAQHLIKAGYRLRVWNRSPDKLRTLIDDGAQPCATAGEVADGISALICMLSDGPTCDQVLFGDAGVVPAMAPGTAVIVMSSIPVETAIKQARDAARFSVRYLDAPVSGGQRGAREANLAIMVGGAADDFASVQPLLAAMGRPTLVGPVGCGQLAKLANQMIVASTIAAVAEALLFVECGGADPAKVRDALAGGFADSTILQQHAKRMIDDDFTPGGPSKYQLKDTHAALAYSRTLGVSLPVAGLVDSLFEAMVANGDGDLDHSGLIRELRRRNGLSPRRPSQTGGDSPGSG